jgi:hypothetical protein
MAKRKIYILELFLWLFMTIKITDENLISTKPQGKPRLTVILERNPGATEGYKAECLTNYHNAEQLRIIILAALRSIRRTVRLDIPKQIGDNIFIALILNAIGDVINDKNRTFDTDCEHNVKEIFGKDEKKNDHSDI